MYKYNILINQRAVIENGWNLDIIDLAIFDFIKDYINSKHCVSIHTDDGVYYWVSHKIVLENLPILNIKTRQGLVLHIDKLIQNGLLYKHPDCEQLGKSLYRLGENSDKVIFNTIDKENTVGKKNNNHARKSCTPCKKSCTNYIDNNNTHSSSLRSEVVNSDELTYSLYSQSVEENNNSILPPIIPHDEKPHAEKPKVEIVSESMLMFDEFRKMYRGTKRGLRTEFENFCKKHKDWKEVLLTLKSAYEHQCEVREKARRLGCFVPPEKNLKTYLNQRCWEEEPQFQLPNKKDSEQSVAERIMRIEMMHQQKQRN